jgi:hypothetical protein
MFPATMGGMADNSSSEEQADRRRLFKDVWGAQADERAIVPRSRKASEDMPPLVEEHSSDRRLGEMEKSLLEARTEIEALRIAMEAAILEMRTAIERIASEARATGYTETT